MTKLSFAVSPITMTVQGETFTANPAEFAPIALEAIMAYGVRRWVQDHVNAAAFTFKKAAEDAAAKGETFNDGKPFDARACITARVDAAKSGVLSTPRGAGTAFTELESAIYDTVVKVKEGKAFATIKTALADAKGASTTDRMSAVLKAVAALPDDVRLKVIAMAEKALADAKALRELGL